MRHDRYHIIVASALLLVVAPIAMMAQNVTGTKVIGGTGTPDYATLTAAITDLNAKHASGTVTFLINGDLTESGSPEITDTALTGANNLIIKPNTGKTPTVTFTSVATAGNRSNGGLVITGNSASFGSVGNITIDGSNTVNGTTQDLSFVMNDGTNGRFLIKLNGNTDNITIRNLKMVAAAIKPASASGNRTYGVNCLALAAGAADNLKITNCTIGSATAAFYYGIYKPDGGTLPAGTGLEISGNTIYAQHKGMNIWYAAGTTTISNNTIATIGALSTYVQNSVNGIYIEAWSGTCNIFNNRITARAQVLTQTSLKPLYGILLFNPVNEASPGATANVYNNFISDFRYIGDAASTPSEVNGIAADAMYQTVNIYHNTIYINTDSITTNPVAGIRVYDDSLQSVNLKNNIIVNAVNHDSSYAIYRGTIATNCVINSDYNDLFVSGSNAFLGNFNGTKCKTLANWRTASSQDGHSIDVNPANPFGGAGQLTSLTNLHWVSAPSGAYAGTPIPGYTKDIDGESRSTTKPYMGADEGAAFTGVTPDQGTIPGQLSLDQNYPNPFNPGTEIGYHVPAAGHVTLVVHDLLGRTVATLINERQEAGHHTVRFQASALSSGVYLYKLTSGAHTMTRRMHLIK